MVRRYRSRLARVQRKKKVRSAFLYLLFSFILFCLLIFLGVPFLIRMASFLSEIKAPTEQVEKEDVLAPQPPIFATANFATFSAEIDVKGFAEAGATVVLESEDEDYEVVANNEGQFLFENVGLVEGENHLGAKATDQAGNKSNYSKTLLVIFDKEPPELTVAEPEDGITVTEDKIQIKGMTEKDARLTINAKFVILNAEGEFDYPLKLSEGENEIKIVAVDRAGNRTEKERKIEYKKE